MYILVTALESPGGLIITELMVDGLSHGEFVCICFQKAVDNLFHFIESLLSFLFAGLQGLSVTLRILMTLCVIPIISLNILFEECENFVKI